MSVAVRDPSETVTKALVAAHLTIALAFTAATAVYGTPVTPVWRAVHALWSAQAVLLGVWCGLSAAPLQRKLCMSLVGILLLVAMPIGKQVYFFGVPVHAMDWREYAAFTAMYLFPFGLDFAATFGAMAFARAVWPRWRLVRAAALAPNPRGAQFSISQLMLGIMACTPLLAAVRIVRDYVELDIHDASHRFLGALVQCPLAATAALLSVWAALGRTHVAFRMAATVLAIPIAVLLLCYATKYPPSMVFSRIGYEEMEMAVVVVTLLICRRNEFRIAAVPAGSPFCSDADQAAD